MSEKAADLDREYGLRMKSLRDDAGLTQASVVKQMRAAGVDHMNASTLSRIEAGQRALRLSEASALAKIYQYPLSMFAMGPEPFKHFQTASASLDEANRKYREFRELVDDLYAVHVRMPGLIRGIDIFVPPGDDQRLNRSVGTLKANMQKFADRDFVEDVIAARDRAAAQLATESDRVHGGAPSGSGRGADGEHQAEA